MDNPSEKGSGFKGQHQIRLPARVTATALRERPLLRGLLVTGAGCFPQARGHLRRRPAGLEESILIYCVKGGGWYELGGQLRTLREGGLLVLPPGAPHSYGAHASNPWTIHWVHAVGAHLRDYLHELGVSVQAPVIELGEDLQVVLLFNEVVRSLERGLTFLNLLHASNTLAHLLALLIRHRHERPHPGSDGVEKVAQCIIYMSEHLDQPLRVTDLAALANLSPAHFTALFGQQTGCSPRDYLHLLRIHRACQLLHGTALPVKDIAGRLGYQDPFHFSRQFKAFQGVSPSEFRASR